MVRLIKILWILLSVLIAIWGALMGGEAQIIAIYLIGLLTMPLGLVLYVFASFTIGALTKSNPESYGSVINIVICLLAIFAGYIQWFIFLPKIYNRMRHEKSPKLWGLLMVCLVAIVYGLYRFYIHAFPSQRL